MERLSPGDAACVAGPEGVLPVRWIGHRRLSLDALAEAELFAPVRVCAGAVAPGLPVRDLLLSPDHAVLLDGVLVPVRQLINGRTIRAEPARGAVTYWHVALERHAVLRAAGLAAESLQPGGEDGFFANDPACVVRHPPLLPATRVAPGLAAPLLRAEAEVRPLWARLAARAARLGHAPLGHAPWRPAEARPAAPRLRLPSGRGVDGRGMDGRAADGRVVAPVLDTGDAVRFALPPGVRQATLWSEAARPTALAPWLDDRRRLGLRVRSVSFTTAQGEEVALPLDHPGLCAGWWAEEGAGRDRHRWTDGAATVPVPAGALLMTVRLADRARIPLAPPGADGEGARQEAGAGV